MPRSPDGAGASADGPTILVVSDQRDWHARQMEAAFAAVGARVERIDLAECGFDTRSASGLALPHLGSRLPDAVHVRTLSAGSFEATTKRLGVLHALTKLGVVVWNDARAIERCVDKSMTSFLLARAGVPTPPTWTMESAEAARALVERESPRGPLVLKPLFGAQGIGLRLIRRSEDLPDPEDVAGVYYLQRFQSNGTRDFTDYRLFVLRGQVVAAMMRRASTWITNVKQGGEPLAVAPDPAMERLAVSAAEAVGAAIAGVDVLVGADGAPTVLEVNSMPAWSGLQKVSKRNIAEAIALALMDTLARRPAQRRGPMNGGEDRVAGAYIEACLAELDAPKPGNVHRFAPGHGMEVEDFIRSAQASAAPIAARGARVGIRVRGAVEATLEAVGQNTNLGIILLCAPLAAAAEAPGEALRPALATVLDRLDQADARDVFAAITAANPAGLGRAQEHDVHAPAVVTLREAMAEAAERDRIARQYVTAYEDVFSLGLPALATARRRQSEARWSTLAVYLTFLAAAPDTHILRKFDAETAEAVRCEAAHWRDAFVSACDPERLADGLLSWDAALKSRGINPGTSADLTVATLFASSLSAIRGDKYAPAILPLRANDA